MDYSNIFSYMQAEVTLIAVIVLLFLYDLIAGERGRRWFSAVACGLLAVQVLANVVPGTAGEVFGGMFCYVPMHTVVKSVLAIGALIVCLQAGTWLRRDDTAHKQGEFYILLLSTLLGMYFMVGAGNFLLFFLGMELASVPMACLVAFDKYKHHSAEAGAKYILCALFASGLMLYGISFLYGTTGTLYFGDMAARIDGSPLLVMALVFFLSGLGFKISLVPFHLWTADAYQGAPTNVTAYLSVVSKGAAAFVLLTVGLSMVKFQVGPVHCSFSLLLVCMMTGTVFCNICPTSEELMDRLDRWVSPVNILFFVLSGAELDLNILTNPLVLLIGVVYILSRSAGKIMGAYGSCRMTHCSTNIQKYLGITLLPQAGVALGMAAEAAALSDGHMVRNVVLFSVLVYELVGPTLTKLSLTAAGEIAPEGRTSARTPNVPDEPVSLN